MCYETPHVVGDLFIASEHVSLPSDDSEHSPDVDADSLYADDDSRWDVFLPDDDEVDPLPEPGDFWFDDD
jgi:hypothetical protein